MKHQDIIELLPWYANATLANDERKTVETHLANCQECAQELKSLTTVRNAVVELGDRVPAPSPRQLNRALAEIENYENSKAQAGNRRTTGSLNRIAAFWTGWWQTPAFARSLIAVQAILLVGLAVTALYQYRHQNTVYVTSSGPSVPGTGAKIVVGFEPGVSEEQLRKTIQDIDGQIVGGPSALDLYTVQLKIPKEKTAEIDKILERLRQSRRVVRVAQETQ